MTIEREEEGQDRSGPLPSTSNHLSGNVQGEHFKERLMHEVNAVRLRWKVL